MAKNIQIPEPLYEAMVTYICDDNARTDDLLAYIIDGIEAKAQRQMAHNLYTASKIEATDHDKDIARRAYLDLRGVPEDFRR